MANDISVLIKQEDKNSALLPKVKLNDNLKAPIKKGDLIGKVSYIVEDITYTEDLIANSNVKKSKALIIIVIILLLLCLTFLRFRAIKRRNKRLKDRQIRNKVKNKNGYY